MLQEKLKSRPTWLAARLSLTELQPVIKSHRSALRLLHRLLLVITVDTLEYLDTAQRLLRSEGLSFADWDSGEEAASGAPRA